MRRILSIIAYFSALPLMLMAQQHSITITGNVANFNNGDKITVTQRGDYRTNTIAKSSINPDGTYRISVPVEKPGVARLICGNYENTQVWIEDEDFSVDFTGKDTSKVRMMIPKQIIIKGGPKSKVMNWSNFIDIKAYEDMFKIHSTVTGKEIPKERLDSIRGELLKASRKTHCAYAREIVKNNQTTTSVISLFPILLSEDDDQATELIEETLDILTKTNPNSNAPQIYRKEREEKLALERAAAVGAIAPDITAHDINGKPLNISSFKGKVLIIDFWASWCGPCRAEIPKLKNIYDDFKDNSRVAFLSISIDGDKDAWLNAVKNENMPWKQLLMPNEGQEALKAYQFSGIPFIICLDENGTIFRKHLRGDAVRTAIMDALNN